MDIETATQSVTKILKAQMLTVATLRKPDSVGGWNIPRAKRKQCIAAHQQLSEQDLSNFERQRKVHSTVLSPVKEHNSLSRFLEPLGQMQP